MFRIFFFTAAFTGLQLCTRAQNQQLQYYVDHAMANSPLLKEYQNQLELNKYDSFLIKASFKPQVTGSSINNYAPVIKGWGYDAAITNGSNFATLVGVNQLLPNKKSLSAQFENIGLQRQSVANTARISEQDLKRNIISQYITAAGSLQQLAVNRAIGKLLEDEEIVLKKLTRSNVYRQSDYLAFLVTLQQQQLLVKQWSFQYANDLNTLNYYCGISDTTNVQLQEPSIQLSLLPGAGQSVFFRQFNIDSLKLSNSKKLIDIGYRPKINLYADAGFNSTLAYSAYKNIGTSFGISIVLPIYDGKQRQLQYAKIDIAENTRKGYEAFFKSQYQQQIAQLSQQLVATENLIGDINKQLTYTKSLVDVNGKLLETGEVRITDYIMALNNYINAKNLLAQNNISRLQIINQINYWNR